MKTQIDIRQEDTREMSAEELIGDSIDFSLSSETADQSISDLMARDRLQESVEYKRFKESFNIW